MGIWEQWEECVWNYREACGKLSDIERRVVNVDWMFDGGFVYMRDKGGRFVKRNLTMAQWIDIAMKDDDMRGAVNELFQLQLLSGEWAEYFPPTYTEKTKKRKDKHGAFKDAYDFFNSKSFSGFGFDVNMERYNLFNSGESLGEIPNFTPYFNGETLMYDASKSQMNKYIVRGTNAPLIFPQMFGLSVRVFGIFVTEFLVRFVEQRGGRITDIEKYVKNAQNLAQKDEEDYEIEGESEQIFDETGTIYPF